MERWNWAAALAMALLEWLVWHVATRGAAHSRPTTQTDSGHLGAPSTRPEQASDDADGGTSGASDPKPASQLSAAARGRLSHKIVHLPAEQELNRAVWQHEAAARELGLVPVVELFATSSEASQRLTALWRGDSELARDTLLGVYLIRVDLGAFGPDAVLGLTPHALHGAPLFVAWTKAGQVLTGKALRQRSEERLALPLSAYFADVVAGRQHDLEPAPPVRVVELARRQAGNLTRPKRSTAAAGAVPAAVESVPAAVESVPPASQGVRHLGRDLDGFLASALAEGQRVLAAMELRQDLSLDSLRELDAHLDALTDVERAALYPKAAALAVYLGEVLRAHADGTWDVDLAAPSALSALRLLGAPERANEPSSESASPAPFQPGELVLERLGSDAIGLYGHAVDWLSRNRAE